MTAAAKNLTPVVLELGGKSPTIVHSSADLRVAARRIAQGRWNNAGQTCTAPDYVLVFKDVAKPFLGHLKEAILHFYGDDPQKSPDYGRIVSTRHFDRLTALLASGTVFHGGRHDRSDRFIAPTVLVNVSPNAPVMQEEIFGPILPVLEVDSVRQVIDFVNARPSPLGLYVFVEDPHVAAQILDSTTSGDAAVNDCTIQPLIPDLPFGGVGNSGWASITASGDSAATRTPAAFCTTARGSTPTSATRRTAVRRHHVNWSLRNRAPKGRQGPEPNRFRFLTRTGLKSASGGLHVRFR